MPVTILVGGGLGHSKFLIKLHQKRGGYSLFLLIIPFNSLMERFILKSLLLLFIFIPQSLLSQDQKRFGLEIGLGVVYNPTVTKYEETAGVEYFDKNPVGSGINVSGVFRISPKSKIDIFLFYAQNNFKRYVDESFSTPSNTIIQIQQYIRESHFFYGVGIRGETSFEKNWILQPECSFFILNWLSEEIIIDLNGNETSVNFATTGTRFNPNNAEAGLGLGCSLMKKLGNSGKIGLKLNVNSLLSAPSFFGVQVLPTIGINL